MSNQTRLEIAGTLSEHPFAELLVETTEALVSGSFRISNGDQKMIVYLNQGKVVFAVSNLREHRLFSLALSENVVTENLLKTIPQVANDLELSAKLVSDNIASQSEIDAMVARQVMLIVEHGLRWESGEWKFSSLARARDGINYNFDLQTMLLEYGRNLSADEAVSRFESDDERFGIRPDSPFHLNLQTNEAFVLSRFDQEFLTVSDVDNVSGLPEASTRQLLFSLWLGGFLFRKNWNSVLSDGRISEMLDAKLQLVETQPEALVIPQLEMPETQTLTGEDAKAALDELKDINEEQALYEYLERIESCATLYEALGVEKDAATPDIKKAYFGQAKKYHPDLFHKVENIHLRIQTAFSKLAHAYETLKSEDSRELYNFKMRKELAEETERESAGITKNEANLNKQAEKAAENFQWGMSLFEEEEYADSIQFFARSVHYDDQQAKYHAFYGKALSFDRKHSHQAEGEIQTAIRIEPNNTTYKLMLAELFVKIGLKKRAEGELIRLLSITPNDQDAKALLDSLQTK